MDLKNKIFRMKFIKNIAEDIVYYNMPRPTVYPYRSYEAVEYLLKNFEFETLLDVGSGGGKQAKVFVENGKSVTTLDYGKSYAYEKFDKDARMTNLVGDINTYEFDKKYDVVFCSHVLEHQLNVQTFLEKILDAVDEGGIICITVPPLKQQITSGHVNLWNPGLLIYRLILAGCDCNEAHVKQYDYDISIIVRKKTIEIKHLLRYDRGDIKTLRQYFPKEIEMSEYSKDCYFDGRKSIINW